jgi:hypothetical protein
MQFDLSHLSNSVRGEGKSILNISLRSILQELSKDLLSRTWLLSHLTKLMLEVNFNRSFITEEKTKIKQNMLKISLNTKVILNSNNGKSHHKISGIH